MDIQTIIYLLIYTISFGLVSVSGVLNYLKYFQIYRPILIIIAVGVGHLATFSVVERFAENPTIKEILAFNQNIPTVLITNALITGLLLFDVTFNFMKIETAKKARS